MAQVNWNEFINTHHTGACLFLQFSDYRSGLIDRSGKVLPTPNQVVRHLCRHVRGDVALKSLRNGRIQQLVFAVPADAQRIAKMLGGGKFERGVDAPCRASAAARIEMPVHIKLAQRFGLY